MAGSGPFTARARTDARDWLIEADEPLAGLQLRSGGELPGIIASPALLELVRKSRLYGLRLARAIRPFILRRTKEQVAKDLPAKLEQTIFCELEPAQRKLYDELRQHYRTSLLERIARGGINKAKIEVLEALLTQGETRISPSALQSLVSRCTGRGASTLAMAAQVGRVPSAADPAALIEPFDRVIWWQMAAPVLPRRYPWTKGELAALARIA